MVRARTSESNRASGYRSRFAGVSLVLLLGLVFTIPAHAQKAEKSVKEQLAFGVDMAKRGLWSEALFRFRQAERLDPDNPSVFNNLAVAHEAIGLFEEALELYRQGLELSPQDKGLRNNYARFIDFYNRFRPKEEEPGETTAEAAPDASSAVADERPATDVKAEVEPPVSASWLTTAGAPRNMS